jgi:nucleoprotein TPR
VLEAQRRDYKRALAAHNRLSQKLQDALGAGHAAAAAAADATAAADAHGRANQALTQQVADLSRQVQHLLRAQLQRAAGAPKPAAGSSGGGWLALRGQTPTRPTRGSAWGSPARPPTLALTPDGGAAAAEWPSPPDKRLLSAHAVVTEALVCVDDVDDLQRKNLYLVATVRSLTDELEARGDGLAVPLQGGGGGGKVGVAAAAEVAALVAEVAEMRAARVRQEELVGAIVRQRDMYRLAAHASGSAGGGDPSALAAWGGGGGPGAGGAAANPPASPEGQALRPSAAAQAAAAAAEVEAALRQQVSELERNLARAGGERDMLRQVVPAPNT